jgi:nitrogen regulatory protein P-II 1
MGRTHLEMQLRKVTAIIRCDHLEEVEEKLKQMLVKGLSVSHVKGYGEYANFCKRDWQVRHARVEIFAEAARAEEIARAIMETAHTGQEGDGLVVILPVEKLFRVRTKREAQPTEI